MRNAAKALILGAAATTIACSKHEQQQQPNRNDEMSLEDNIASGRVPPNTEIETLPPDESSGTSSSELNSGDDNPDVNDVGNSH